MALFTHFQHIDCMLPKLDSPLYRCCTCFEYCDYRLLVHWPIDAYAVYVSWCCELQGFTFCKSDHLRNEAAVQLSGNCDSIHINRFNGHSIATSLTFDVQTLLTACLLISALCVS